MCSAASGALADKNIPNSKIWPPSIWQAFLGSELFDERHRYFVEPVLKEGFGKFSEWMVDTDAEALARIATFACACSNDLDELWIWQAGKACAAEHPHVPHVRT